jgi:hypothetical protein
MKMISGSINNIGNFTLLAEPCFYARPAKRMLRRLRRLIDDLP